MPWEWWPIIITDSKSPRCRIKHDRHPLHKHTFLGLLAKIKCSFCSLKFNSFRSPIGGLAINPIFRGQWGALPGFTLGPHKHSARHSLLLALCMAPSHAVSKLNNIPIQCAPRVECTESKNDGRRQQSSIVWPNIRDGQQAVHQKQSNR